MRRTDKRGLRGHETAGEKGDTGMMYHLAVYLVKGGQPRGKWTRADRAGVPECMHLHSPAIGRLLPVAPLLYLRVFEDITKFDQSLKLLQGD